MTILAHAYHTASAASKHFVRISQMTHHCTSFPGSCKSIQQSLALLKLSERASAAFCSDYWYCGTGVVQVRFTYEVVVIFFLPPCLWWWLALIGTWIRSMRHERHLVCKCVFPVCRLLEVLSRSNYGFSTVAAEKNRILQGWTPFRMPRPCEWGMMSDFRWR